MSRRKLTACLALSVSLVLTYFIAARVMVVHATLPPQSARTDILMALVKPPYQMAAPHQSVLKKVLRLLVPTVHAYCPGDSPCAYLKDMVSPNPACTGPYAGSSSCPDCLNGPCHVHMCVDSTRASDICGQYYDACQPFACARTGACNR